MLLQTILCQMNVAELATSLTSSIGIAGVRPAGEATHGRSRGFTRTWATLQPECGEFSKCRSQSPGAGYSKPMRLESSLSCRSKYKLVNASATISCLSCGRRLNALHASTTCSQINPGC